MKRYECLEAMAALVRNERIAYRTPRLFAHWQLLYQATARQ